MLDSKIICTWASLASIYVGTVSVYYNLLFEKNIFMFIEKNPQPLASLF